MQKALELLGGRASELDARLQPEGGAGTIASLEVLGEASEGDLDRLTGAAGAAPLFLHPGRSGLSSADEAMLARLGAPELTITPPAAVEAYAFSTSDALWPFSGARLGEERPRVVAALEGQIRGVDSLIATPGGNVFLRWRRGSQDVFLTAVPLPDLGPSGKLKDEFGPTRFAALLPLLVFARAALGEAGWRTPLSGANLLVDDPNLRSHRYGFMDYPTVVEAARERELHFTIAMSPIDHGKTREPVARFVRDNSRYISLVPHGVEHLKREFERDVGPEAAVAALLDGMRRMAQHEAETGIRCPHAMTLPHGSCNATWLEAMRRTGFDATFASRSFPFKRDSEIGEPLYEMLPAELSYRGYPVVNRFKAEEAKERLLFEAWLGKPLVVYTHHEFFRDGMARTFEITDFLRRQVGPVWGDIQSILGANFQARTTVRGREIRAFSNAISIEADGAAPIVAVGKPHADPAEEGASVDGEDAPAGAGEGGLLVTELGEGRRRLSIEFRPRDSRLDGAAYRTPRRARLRRLATETRDRSLALADRLRGRNFSA